MRFSSLFKVLSQDLKQSPTLQKTAAESSSARPHASPCNFDRNIHSGDTAGKGGEGGRTGDEGGLGEAAQLASENVNRFRRIHGTLSYCWSCRTAYEFFQVVPVMKVDLATR